jgi:tetratricopeptide (TPR) repeat protein
VVVKCSLTGPHEAFILGSLSHPNIVPIHSSRHDEVLGLCGISMPLLGRNTLADALNRLAAEGNAARTADLFTLVAADASRPAKVIEKRGDYTSSTIALIQRITLGLAAAHQAGVVHGDIKPSNVLLSFAGEPMLMDFNLSAGPGGDFDRAGGTPPYMAPECLADFWREPHSEAGRLLDPRSDLFSVGVVLLELLLGPIRLRFDFDRPELLPKEEDWRDLIRQATAVSHEPKLRGVLERCLAFDLTQRYASAAELARDLTAILDTKQRMRLWTRRIAVAAAASAVIGTSVTLWAWTREDPQSLPALLRRAKVHIDREEFQDAVILLDQAQRLRNDTRFVAWSGYCLAHLSHYETAKAYFTAALQHEDRADLRNNLGYCCAMMRRAAEAEEHFERALVLDPNLQAAFHNRANLRRDGATRGHNLQLPPGCWSDYQRAASVGRRNGELCLDSAKAIAFAHLRNQPIEGDLNEQVRAALAAGVDPQLFRGTRFAHERLDLDELARQAQDLQEPPIPRSAPLILPPPFPLPER